MTNLFLMFLQMSLMAAGVTVIALPLRWLFRRLRLPALACVLLWLVVALRMVLPVGMVTSSFSLMGWLTPAVEERVRDELNQYFRPEFINRVDDIVVFSPLTESQITGIIDIAMSAIAARLADREITVTLTGEAKAFIAHASYTPAYGARPVKRYLQKYVETELAAMLIRGQVSDGQTVTVGSDGEKLTFTVTQPITQ